MTAFDLHARLLTIRMTFARFGCANILAGALCVAGVAGWTWAVPHIRTQIAIQKRAIFLARQSLVAESSRESVPPRPLAEERLVNFYDNLGEKRYAEQQVKTLFAIAGKMQLLLNQAEYKPAFDKNGGYHTYQIVLPIKGSYGAVRQFCEQILLSIPFVSLDEINFKRDTIGSQTLEAKLRFTLYLADEATQNRLVATGKGDDS